MVVRKRLNITGPTIAFVTTIVFKWKPILAQDKIATLSSRSFEILNPFSK